MNYANQYKKLLNLDRDSLFCSPNVERGIRPRSSPKPGLEPIYVGQYMLSCLPEPRFVAVCDTCNRRTQPGYLGLHLITGRIPVSAWSLFL